MAQKTSGKGFLNSKFFSSTIKSANVKLFPEGLLGYLVGPIMALISNAVINTYLLRYYQDVMGLGDKNWAGSALFLVLLQVLSAFIIVIGNIVVGRLMDKVKTKNGKARPLLVASIPLIALALFVLFLAPFPWQETEVLDSFGFKILKLDETAALWSMIVMAVGYNLYYAICYPFYYTSHSALVNLSTRNSGHRGLLATLSNAAVVGAAGLAGMAMPFFLNLLFIPRTMALNGDATTAVPFNGKEMEALNKALQAAKSNDRWGINTYDRIQSYNNWKIFLIALVITLVIGALVEFYFTRERITEEEFARSTTTEETKKNEAVPMSKQIAVCMKDKYWWLVMGFFFLYQLGGMMKNNSATYFSVAWSGTSDLAGLINGVGAVPTAVGMVAVGILAMKFGKANSIKWGAVIATAFGALSFLLYLLPADFIAAYSIVAFSLKACGTVPAMYISLALLSDVLDHQEALYGFRTDGFSMAVYGAIMIAMTGIANGIIAALTSAAGYTESASSPAMKTATIWAFFGGETICYGLIAALFFFMGVEKYTALDHAAIEADQKAAAEARGEKYISAAERAAAEEAQAEKEADEARKIELKAACEKKGLDFEAEEAKYQEAAAAKKAEAEKKAAEAKAKAEAKKAEAEAKKTDAQRAKEEAAYAALVAEYEEMRKAAKASPLHI